MCVSCLLSLPFPIFYFFFSSSAPAEEEHVTFSLYLCLSRKNRFKPMNRRLTDFDPLCPVHHRFSEQAILSKFRTSVRIGSWLNRLNRSIRSGSDNTGYYKYVNEILILCHLIRVMNFIWGKRVILVILSF